MKKGKRINVYLVQKIKDQREALFQYVNYTEGNNGSFSATVDSRLSSKQLDV